jgi:hypothetical protein
MGRLMGNRAQSCQKGQGTFSVEERPFQGPRKDQKRDSSSRRGPRVAPAERLEKIAL